MKLLCLSFILFFQWLSSPVTDFIPSDSSRAVKILSKAYPQESRRDYKRFMKVYNDPLIFEKLVRGRDSAQVQQLFGAGALISRDLFELTFDISDPDFSYALLYKNHFGNFKVKPDDWYLQQFAILFNAEGKAYKIFDHQTRGYNLFDKRKRKSI